MRLAAYPPFEPFFLPAARGERFCIYHPAQGEAHGAVVYVHPFAEEMNKSRRMAALQSRQLAARGYAVLQIDLYGCGDSSGEFRDASWTAWTEDVALAVDWLRRRVPAPLHLWGLRLGALLALDYAGTRNEDCAGFLLWQPVTSGASFLTQFLRMRVAADMAVDAAGRVTTQELRAQLAAGAALEIGGYELSPALAQAIDGLKLAELAPTGGAPVRWLEVVAGADGALPPASQRIVDAWAARGIAIEAQAVAGDAFWSSVEIVECPALLEHTLRAGAGATA